MVALSNADTNVTVSYSSAITGGTRRPADFAGVTGADLLAGEVSKTIRSHRARLAIELTETFYVDSGLGGSIQKGREPA